MRVFSITLGILCLLGASALLGQGTITAVRPDGVPVTNRREVKVSATQWVGLDMQTLIHAGLYYRREGENWTYSGVTLTPAPDAQTAPYFRFQADRDGLYEFLPTWEQQTPPATISGTLRVYIDTQAPAVQIIEPQSGSEFKAGETVTIRYEAQDVNLDTEKGLTIEYSIDGGASWTPLVQDGPITGSYEWNPAFLQATSVDFRLVVRDLVGNAMPVRRGGVMVSIPLPPPPPPPAPPMPKRADRPYVHIVGPRRGKIYYENTDFYHEVTNRTGEPTAMVVIYYSMDGGQSWQFGGSDMSGEDKGKIVVNFREGFLRHKAFGNYETIGFYYQVLTSGGLSNALDPDDPANADRTPHASYQVDTDPPKFHLKSPTFGDKLYRGVVPGNAESGRYDISWGGADRNPIPYVDTLGYERGPVSIFYTSEPRSQNPAWTMLSDRLPLNGSFERYNDLPLGTIQIRVEAEDEMGNKAVRYSGIFEVLDGVRYGELVRGDNDTDVDRLWSAATQFFNTADYPAAIAKYDRAIALAPPEKVDAIRHDRALALYRDGRVATAVDTLAEVVKKRPESLTFRFSLATLYLKTGRRAAAQQELEIIARSDDGAPHFKARLMLAGLYVQAGEAAKAKGQYEFIVTRASQSSAEYGEANRHLASGK